ncbi:hypothetical protein ACH5RR_001785 [Cinchona calisaya]|uniref:Uncharacterized protein n=1 Tax=Cinchona calisaya TaxID=153742 RepID=A0ABD3B4N5_9GENT
MLGLRSWNLGPRFPSWLRSQRKIQYLDLSSTGISETIPTWLWMLSTDFMFLNLSNNQFQELCHQNSLRIIDVSNNKFFGAIPRCVKNFTSMTREKNVLLDAQITGNYTDTDYIPSENLANKGNEYDYGAVLSFFTNIDLSNNYFSSNIPDELTSLLELKSLNL